MRADLEPVRQLLGRRGPAIALKVALGLIVVLCATLALGGEVSRLRTDQLRFAPGWLALAVVGLVALQLMHAGLWRAQLSYLAGPIPPRRARAIWCTSAVARYVPTSLLMPTLRIAMCERLRVPKRLCLASLVYETALVLAGALLVAGYFVVELPQLRGEPGRWLAVALPVLAVAAMQPRIFGPVSAAALRRLGREPLARLLPERVIVAVWLGYAASFVFAGLALFALASALYPVDVAGLPQVTGAVGAGFAISVLAFMLPGGLGAREAGIAAALAPAMPTVVAIAVAIALRVVQITIEIILAGLTPVLARGEDAGQPEAKYAPGGKFRSAARHSGDESMRCAEPRSASTNTTAP
jgi:hypothetical protein